MESRYLFLYLHHFCQNSQSSKG